MLTDNPASGKQAYRTKTPAKVFILYSLDIAGANTAGWSSVLVRTGVFDPREGTPRHTPTHVAEDVEEAVQWAIQKEYEKQRAC